MLKKILMAGVALAAFTGVASAADIVPDTAFSWTGIYLGVGAGARSVSTDFEGLAATMAGNPGYVDESSLENTIENNQNTGGEGIAAFLNANLGSTAFIGTGELGLDYQIDRLVIGVVGNYDFGSNSDSAGVGAFGWDSEDAIGASVEGQVEMGDSWGIGGRVGFLPTERTLFYGVGGYSEADMSIRGSLNFLDTEVAHIGDSGWQSGFFVGGGIETMLTDNISAKVEYRYSRYKGLSAKVADDCDGDCSDDVYYDAAQVQSDDADVHTIRATVAFRFGNF